MSTKPLANVLHIHALKSLAPGHGLGRWVTRVEAKVPLALRQVPRCPKLPGGRASTFLRSFRQAALGSPNGLGRRDRTGKKGRWQNRDVPAFTALLPLPHPQPLAEEETFSARGSAGCGAVGPRGVLVAGGRDLDGWQLQELLARSQNARQVPGQPGL